MIFQIQMNDPEVRDFLQYQDDRRNQKVDESASRWKLAKLLRLLKEVELPEDSEAVDFIKTLKEQGY